MVDAWEDISGPRFEGVEYHDIWARFGPQFRFSPGITSMPAIQEPIPSLTYYIGHIYGPAERYSTLVPDLNARMLAAFRHCVPNDGWLYALDWHHPCYRFRPHVPFAAENEESWRVPVLPNGDYYIFLAEDLSFGIFGHPWEETICVFGVELLSALAQGQPAIFDTIVRENGRQVRPLVLGTYELESGDEMRRVVGPQAMPLTSFLPQLEGTVRETWKGEAKFKRAAVTEDISS